ncbi:MAG: hypothetical protein WBB48_07320 [Thermodesulfobacteriota bacterium]
MAKKKNNLSKNKIPVGHELQTEPNDYLDGSTRVIDSFIRNRNMVSIFLFVLAFVVFIPSLSNDFVWDDVSYIQKKAGRLNFSKLGSELIVPELKSRSNAGKYFRPVYQASLIVDNEIWNTSPFGFHLTNIILHSVSTVFLYFLVLLLLKEFHVQGRNSIAFFSSVLFALYPLHVEPVSFISARGDILAAMFFFLAISFYILSYRKIFYLFLAGICFLLSFLSKEVAIVLPIIIIAFDLITFRLLKRTNLIKYSLILLVTTFYLVIRSQSYSTFGEILRKGSSEMTLGFLGVSELFFNTYLFYFIKLVFPYDINPFIGSVPNWGVFGLITSVTLILVLSVAVFVSIKKKENITAFSIVWILATLLPAAIVAILSLAVTKLADRFLYIPSAAICILFGYLIYRISIKFNKAWLSYGITTILAISFLVVSVNGQKMWKNNLSLWEYAVSKSPSAIGAKINYGDALRNSGNPSEALKQYLHVNENNSVLNTKAKLTTTHGIVVSYIDLGNYQQAQKWLDVALTYDQRYRSQYYYLMGFISLRKNDPINAETYFLKSLEIGPSYKTSYLLGGIYFHTAQEQQSFESYKKAEKYLNESLMRNPNFSRASLLLAKTYIALGDKQKARVNAENALRNADSQEVINGAQSILQMK